jgi:hypothetical protein
MVGNSLAAGAVGLHLIDGVPLLRPDEQVFTAKSPPVTAR